MAIDLYGDHVPEDERLWPEDITKVDAFNKKCFKGLVSLDHDHKKFRSLLKSWLDIGLGLPYVDNNYSPAAIGYCFGGLVVLDLARSGEQLRGVVSFHGLLMPSDISKGGIKAKVLVLHGERDPMVPLDMVDSFQNEMTTAGVDWQLHSYGGTYHAFTNPGANDPSLGTQYNKSANDRSWQSMTNFFGEIFN